MDSPLMFTVPLLTVSTVPASSPSTTVDPAPAPVMVNEAGDEASTVSVSL